MSRDCPRHQTCRKLDKLVTSRVSSWIKQRQKLEEEKELPILSQSLGSSSPLRPIPVPAAEQRDLADCPALRPVYMDRDCDLKQIKEEEERLLALSIDLNRNLVTEGNVAANEVVITGNVQLSADEISLLNLGPDYMVVKPLDNEDMEVEAVVTMTKLRWGRRCKGMESMTDKEILNWELENPTTDEEETMAEALECAARDVVEVDEITVNLGKKCATDMRNNRRVFMPGPAPVKVEASHTVRMGVWTDVFSRYRKTHCNEEGVPARSNLTVDQQLALKSLGKKIAKLELILMEADKGKRFVATDQATYLAMAADHTAKDRPVEEEELRMCQRTLSATAMAMVNMFGVGKEVSHSNYCRCFDNAGSEAQDAPTLKILLKVHKPPTPEGHPAYRPVVTAATGMSSRAGDILSDFLKPLILVDTPRQEDQSTEEVLAQLEEAQRAIIESGATDVMVGSLDVQALYPSLDQDHAAELVSQMVHDSKARLTGINYRCVQTFVASNMTEKEVEDQGFVEVLLARLKKGGNRPGPRTLELRTKIPEGKEEPPGSKWEETNPDKDLTEQQRRQILSEAVRLAVKIVFSNHVYQFCGVLYRQLAGGPIGLRLTSIVARVVMDGWSRSFLYKLDVAGWRLWVAVKYVDDVNVVASMVDKNLEWVGDELGADPSKSVIHEEETQETHSMRLIREAADSVYPMLEFTMDLPSLHDSEMVPMLDLQVWVERHPAGSGDPAGTSSQQGPRGGIRPLPAGTEGDPAVVTSLGPLGNNPAGTGEPAGKFSHQGPHGGS